MDKKIAYQDSSLLAVRAVENNNEIRKKEAKAEHEEALAEYNRKTSSKGAGLGGIAVFSSLLLYLCLWYIEYYDFKTATQYGTLITQQQIVDASQIVGGNALNYQRILNVLQQQEAQLKKHKSASTPPPQHPTNQNEVISHLYELQLPIGFYSDGERQEQLKNLYIQNIQPYIQHIKTVQFKESDKYTIEHTNFRTGEVEHLDFKTVNNRVGIYLLKINNSIAKGNEGALPNQFEKLMYWLTKRGDFLNK